MDQTLDVDRYLTQRVGIVRRLLDADVPAAAAERWVAAWEEEAERRGLDPRDGEWWRSAWGWIARDCGSGHAEDPGSPNHEWLRRQMEGLCAAYEAAVGEAHRPRAPKVRRARTA
jgi:hypothetical protein